MDGAWARDQFAWNGAIPALGGLLLAGIVVRCLLFGDGLGGHLVHLVFLGAFAVAVVAMGGWLATGSELPPRVVPRIAGWCLLGSAVLGTVVAVLLHVNETVGVERFLFYVQFAGSVGAAGGVAIGIQEARAIERARQVERESTRAARVEQERERLDYLNSILRHEVLNDATQILGYADLARDADPERRGEHLDVVTDKTEDVVDVIEDVRVVIDSLDDASPLEPVDLSAVLADEVEALLSTHPAVEVETTVPDDVFVRADGLLDRVFGNLLANAVQHHRGPNPRVSVTVDPEPSSVAVVVSDDGPGVPEYKLDDLFEPSGTGDDGLGLFIARSLVERYGGDIELTETGADGTTFSVTLPRERPADCATADATGATDPEWTGDEVAGRRRDSDRLRSPGDRPVGQES